MFAPNALLV